MFSRGCPSRQGVLATDGELWKLSFLGGLGRAGMVRGAWLPPPARAPTFISCPQSPFRAPELSALLPRQDAHSRQTAWQGPEPLPSHKCRAEPARLEQAPSTRGFLCRAYPGA